MQTEGDLLGQGPGQTGGAAGAPDPSSDEVAKLKAENAQLREEQRKSNARELGAKHGLTETQVELISSLSRDQQPTYAERLAAEMKGQQPAAAEPSADAKRQDPGPAAAAPPGAQGPDLSDKTQATLQAMDSDRGQQTAQPAPAESLQQELSRRLLAAGSMEEITEIQREFKQRVRDEEASRIQI